MGGGSKKQFIRRSPLPTVASANDFEERFARQAESRRHYPLDLPIDLIDPSPFQVRQTFDDIAELAEAIQLHGFTSRLWVREHPTMPGRYQLVFGERRLRAARAAGLSSIPCEVTQFDDRELLEIGLTENLQRRDLDPLEEARGLQRFVNEFGYSHRELAARLGKERSYVEGRLALLRTPADVQQMVVQRPDSIRAAREIAKLPTAEERRPLIDGVVAGTLSKEDVRALVRDLTDAPGDELPPPAETGRASTYDLDRRLQRDMQMVRAAIARWESSAPSLDSAQRTRLLSYIEAHVTDLERLTALLDAGAKRRPPRS